MAKETIISPKTRFLQDDSSILMIKALYSIGAKVLLSENSKNVPSYPLCLFHVAGTLYPLRSISYAPGRVHVSGLGKTPVDALRDYLKLLFTISHKDFVLDIKDGKYEKKYEFDHGLKKFFYKGVRRNSR